MSNFSEYIPHIGWDTVFILYLVTSFPVQVK